MSWGPSHPNPSVPRAYKSIRKVQGRVRGTRAGLTLFGETRVTSPTLRDMEMKHLWTMAMQPLTEGLCTKNLEKAHLYEEGKIQ